jgi:hypothetical protein
MGTVRVGFTEEHGNDNRPGVDGQLLLIAYLRQGGQELDGTDQMSQQNCTHDS